MAAPFDREPRPGKGAGGDVLALWAERTGRRRKGVPGRGGLRFAFYGRVSTEDWQDPVTSRAARHGPCARWRRSWPIPGTPGGRCGTASAPTST